MAYKQAQGFRHISASKSRVAHASPRAGETDSAVLLKGIAKVLSPSTPPTGPRPRAQSEESVDALTSEGSSRTIGSLDVPAPSAAPKAVETPTSVRSSAAPSDSLPQQRVSSTSRPPVPPRAHRSGGCCCQSDVEHPPKAATAGGLKRTDSKQPALKPASGWPSFTPEDVAAHNTPADAWVIAEGRVYNITELATGSVRHPGGLQVLEKFAGTDVTAHYKHHRQQFRWAQRQVGVIAKAGGGGCAVM
eukprot:TRINITY_DN16578_c0_g2_i1.p1 TRINITY_DN16578_c0_g2~~TRINITY_DN16578_c0_g2_i1.p1  ORF type:complete len:287 (+),score=30.12 TRINITY_DN16578_c0_g2_i1:121-861(+)